MNKVLIVIGIILLSLGLLVLNSCTPVPISTILWEPDGNGFIQFQTNDPANAEQGFVELYDDTDQTPTMTKPVEVTVKKILGYDAAGFGFVFCAIDEKNYYKVLIHVGRMYRVSVVVGGSELYKLKEWTYDPNLKADYEAENTIKVTIDGSVFRFFINNSLEVTTFPSNLLGTTEGKSGFFAWVSTVANEYLPAGQVDIRFKMLQPALHP